MAQQRPTLTRNLSAFDFDVVTDTPRPPSRRPDPTPPEPSTRTRAPEGGGKSDRVEAESR